MAQITRSTKIGGGTTLQSNTLARAADVETDILTLFTAHNNADTGTTKWQVGSFENASSTVVISNNSTGTNDILDARDNGTSVLKVADGGTTTVQATGASAKALIINNGASTGNILEAQDNGSAVVTVADGGAVTLTGTLTFPDGTASAPGLRGTGGNSNSGIYFAGADNLAFSTDGTKRLDLTTTTLTSAVNLNMGSHNITALLNGVSASDGAAYGQVKVLQVVPATSTTAFTTSSGSFQDTNLSASITPSSSSNKVLIIAAGSFRNTGSGATDLAIATLARGSTNLLAAAGGMEVSGDAAAATMPCTLCFLDSPATTSATTYKVQVRNTNGTSNVTFGFGSRTQVILLLEVNGL